MSRRSLDKMLGLSLLALLGSTVTTAAPTLEPRQVTSNDSNGTSSDPCAALIPQDPRQALYRPSAVKTCLQSTPFIEEARQNIMAVVTAMNTLNIFQYNELGNDDPMINQGIDLDSEFKRINSTDYSSDWDFQMDLTNVINSLNDGHYAWQSCYTNLFSTSHFLPIVSLVDGDDTSIFLAPNLPLFASQAGFLETYRSLGINLTELAGAKVTRIEGQSPWEYLDNVAGPAFGGYQDKEQRLNAQFATYTTSVGAFTLRLGGFASARSPPEENNITLTIQTDGREMDVTVPWLSAYNGRQAFSYDSGEQLYQELCLPQAATQSEFGPTANEVPTNGTDPTTSTPSEDTTTTLPSTAGGIESAIQAALASCPIDLTAARYSYQKNPQQSTAYLGGRDVQFYALGDNQKTGVVYLSTFDPKDASGESSDSCTDRFIVDVYLGFQNLSKAGVERIMIDTSNNGGGSVSLNQYFQRYLTGDDYEVDLNFRTLLRDAPLARALMEANIQAAMVDTSTVEGNIYYPGKYRNGTEMIADDFDLFTPGNEYTVNGKTLKTSNYVQDNVQQVDFLENFLNISDTPPYLPNEVVFVGNGLCGSACSSFTNFLIEYYNATAYITSGRPKNSIAFQAFAAGQSTNSASIYKEAASVGFNDTVLLPPLEVVGQFGFTVRGALSPNIAPGTFIQYRSYPAQHSYALTAEQFLDPLENWKYVASKAFA